MRHRIDNSCTIEHNSQYLENIRSRNEVSIVQTTFIDRAINLENLATCRLSRMLLMYRSLDNDRYKFKVFCQSFRKTYSRWKIPHTISLACLLAWIL